MKRYLARKTRQLSLVAAALFGFGLAVGNITVGGLCLLAGEETAEWTAQRFDALCCALLLGLGGAVLRIAGNPTLLLVAVWMWLTNWRQM